MAHTRRQALALRGLVADCRCCGATYTLEQWLELPFVGVQRLDGDATELRDCGGEGCRTTLAVPAALISGEQLEGTADDAPAGGAHIRGHRGSTVKATINRPPSVAYLAAPEGVGLHRVVAVSCDGLRAMGFEIGARHLDEVARVTSGPRLGKIAGRLAERVHDVWTAYQAAGVRDWSKIARDTHALLAEIMRRTDPRAEVVERLIDDTEPLLSADRDNRECEDCKAEEQDGGDDA